MEAEASHRRHLKFKNFRCRWDQLTRTIVVDGKSHLPAQGIGAGGSKTTNRFATEKAASSQTTKSIDDTREIVRKR